MTSVAEIAVPGAPPMRLHVTSPHHPRGSGVVLLHELFGVDAGITEVAEELAGLGHEVLAPELYHRTAPPGLVLERDDAGRAGGFGHLGALGREEVVASVAAALAQGPAGRTGVLGFSAGGHAAFLAACALPVPVTICLYPGWLGGAPADGAVPMAGPTPTLQRAEGLRERLVVIAGEEDRLVDAGGVLRIREALVGCDARVVVLPGAGHAFFWPGTPAYDATARAAAWDVLVEELAGL